VLHLGGSGGEVSLRKLGSVRQSCADVCGQSAEENCVKQDVTVGWYVRPQLRVVGGDVVVVERRCVEELKAALKLRAGKPLKKCLFDSVVCVNGLGGDVACDVTDGGDNIRQQGSDYMQVAKITGQEHTGYNKLSLNVLKPGCRIIRSKWWQSQFCLKTWLQGMLLLGGGEGLHRSSGGGSQVKSVLL
jgi:hypothetical protein